MTQSVPDLKRLVQGTVKRWKTWLPLVTFGFGIIVLLSYVGTELWRTFQGGRLNILLAVLVLGALWIPIISFAWSYRTVVLVAVVGMVIGAVAGIVPYLAIVIIMILLELSPEGQVTSRELSQLFNNNVFSQLFFVAGAASGGPIAVYAYHERKKRDAENDNGR